MEINDDTGVIIVMKTSAPLYFELVIPSPLTVNTGRSWSGVNMHVQVSTGSDIRPLNVGMTS